MPTSFPGSSPSRSLEREREREGDDPGNEVGLMRKHWKQVNVDRWGPGNSYKIRRRLVPNRCNEIATPTREQGQVQSSCRKQGKIHSQ